MGDKLEMSHLNKKIKLVTKFHQRPRTRCVHGALPLTSTSMHMQAHGAGEGRARACAPFENIKPALTEAIYARKLSKELKEELDAAIIQKIWRSSYMKT